MKKMARLSVLVLIVLLATVSALPALAAGEETTTQEYSAYETMETEARRILTCKNGEFPKNLTLDFCDTIMAHNPELGEQLFKHFESVAIPAEEAPNIPVTALSSFNSRNRRDGSYVRQGDGGIFIYDDIIPETETSSSINSNAFETPLPSLITPRATEQQWVTDPKITAITQSTCKVMSFKNGYWYHGSGFFVGSRVVATAAHCLNNNSWSGDYSSGWADNVYIYQAYAPTKPTKAEQQPYNRVYANTKNMAVGAEWIGNYVPDADWGAFETVSAIGSGTTYLKKKQVTASSYRGKTIRIQGYPAPEYQGGPDLRMFYALGKGTSVVTVRTLESSNLNGGTTYVKQGMSGGPVLDFDTKAVIGIQSSIVNAGGNIGYARSVMFDSWLYNKLKTYE